MNLSLKQWIILILIVSAVVSILGGLIRKSLKLVIAGALVVILFGVGFIWLPKTIDDITAGNKTAQEVAQEVTTDGGGIKEAIEQSKETWKDALFGLFDMVGLKFE